MLRRFVLAAVLVLLSSTVTAGLFDAPAPVPPPLEFWQPTRGEAHTIWLPDLEFDAAARQHGIDPTIKDGFAVWGRWWKVDEIFLRARSLSFFPHEAAHIERGHFHD